MYLIDELLIRSYRDIYSFTGQMNEVWIFWLYISFSVQCANFFIYKLKCASRHVASMKIHCRDAAWGCK